MMSAPSKEMSTFTKRGGITKCCQSTWMTLLTLSTPSKDI
jgi:hypothetical protein